MKYEIDELASSYSYELPQILSSIQIILSKNNVRIYNVTPISICFIPWSIQSSQIDQHINGVLSWNAISRTISISYHALLPYTGSKHDYSRVLKWYLSKWNEEHAIYSRPLDIKFVYPGENISELVLQASRKVTLYNMEKVIRMILLRLNDIMENEAAIITDILAGKYPDDLREQLLNEIKITLSEINGIQGPNKNDKRIDI